MNSDLEVYLCMLSSNIWIYT